MRAWAELAWAERRAERLAERLANHKRVHIPMEDRPVYRSDEGLT